MGTQFPAASRRRSPTYRRPAPAPSSRGCARAARTSGAGESSCRAGRRQPPVRRLTQTALRHSGSRGIKRSAGSTAGSPTSAPQNCEELKLQFRKKDDRSGSSGSHLLNGSIYSAQPILMQSLPTARNPGRRKKPALSFMKRLALASAEPSARHPGRPARGPERSGEGGRPPPAAGCGAAAPPAGRTARLGPARRLPESGPRGSGPPLPLSQRSAAHGLAGERAEAVPGGSPLVATFSLRRL